ncbi:hypothetical protein BGX29_000788 [Mortierella sp. GBA35]|nr:hypothetical protein BGX29_000788 [Mortierella sp. GBA35]
MAPDNLAAGGNHAEEDDVFESLAALEGADLRRLDTFLRNNDQDKVLGDLYRITTETGHVKWVCFEHYKETYRQTTLDSFAQDIETAGGVFDPHFRKITISLTSSTTAKDFFRRLAKQTPAVDELDVTLDWNFGSSDLAMLVDKLGQSNVRTLRLDLKDFEIVNVIIAALRPGKGRYHSLLGLLSNTKLRSLTSNLPSSQSPSLLQSFHFLQGITFEDNARLTNILHYCRGLVDLRLGSYLYNSYLDLPLHRTICSLKKLQVLHLRSSDYWSADEETLSLIASETLKDVIFTGNMFINTYLQTTIRQAMSTLEILVLQDISRWEKIPGGGYRLLSRSMTTELYEESVGMEPSPGLLFCRLTHLDISCTMTTESVKFFASNLPRLNLIHFGPGYYTNELYANFASLKSLAVTYRVQSSLQVISETLKKNSQDCQIDAMRISLGEPSGPSNLVLLDFLSTLPLRVLFIAGFSKDFLHRTLESVNLSRLQALSICRFEYDWSEDAILAVRKKEFTEDLRDVKRRRGIVG